MKIGVALNLNKTSSISLARELAQKMRNYGVSVWTEAESKNGSRPWSADVIIVLGGDGTILRAAREYAPQGIPLLGINLGKVGFLAELEVDEIEAHFDRLIAGDYLLEERLMLQVDVHRSGMTIGSYLALNDAVIRTGTARVVELEVTVDEYYYGNCRGDGVICATPTGSTGYSMAAGGPVLWPVLDNIVLTPICPFSPTMKPLVVEARRSILVSLPGPRTAILTLDGQKEVSLVPGDEVEVTGAAVRTRLIKFKTVFSSDRGSSMLSRRGLK